MIKLSGLITEKKELGGALINKIERLTDRNNHTRARAELARHIGDKRLIKAYEGLMYVEDLLRDSNDTSIEINFEFLFFGATIFVCDPIPHPASRIKEPSFQIES